MFKIFSNFYKNIESTGIFHALLEVSETGQG